MAIILIKKDVLPDGLESIQFGFRFNQPIGIDVLPTKLKSIRFGDFFNQPITKNVLPQGLQSIIFGYYFNQPLKKDVLPSGLQEIQINDKFTHSIKNIPASTKLIILIVSNHPLNMRRNYTMYRPGEQNLEKYINTKKEKLGRVYTQIINGCEYYMADVEIIKSDINKEKISELINQVEGLIAELKKNY